MNDSCGGHTHTKKGTQTSWCIFINRIRQLSSLTDTANERSICSSRSRQKKGKKRFKTKRHKFCKNDAGWWGFEITSFALLNNLLPIEWRDWGVVQLYPNRQHRSSIQRGKHEGVNPNSQKVYESQRNPARRHFFPHEIFTSRYRQRKVFY